MKIQYVNQKDFNRLKKLMNGEGLIVKDDYAFTVTTGKDTIVIINQDAPLSDDEFKIVLFHELAHVKGIDDEERADRDALRNLNTKQKKLLMSNWFARHGHDYKK